MNRKLTAAFVGLGSRGNTYARAMARMPERVEIVAAADLKPDRVRRFSDTYHVPEQMRFSSAEELLRQPRLADILVIATMDRQHAPQAMAAMKKGYHLLLEKPISPVLSECMAVAREAAELKREVVVCHVLRYTPFYGRIREIIASGEIGEVVSIEAIEQVQYWHQAHSFVRGNWRNSEETSPMILQKSCHDTDILLWLTGKHCRRVSSFGSLRHFKPEYAPAGAPARCGEHCPAYASCPFSVENCYLRRAREDGYFGWPINVVTPEPTLESLKEHLKNGPYGRCVYHCDNDVVDHQVVNMLLDDEITVTFSMCAFTGKGGRHIHVMGTKGDIVGIMEDERLDVRLFAGQSRTESTRRTDADQFGHGGGDGALVQDLVDLFEEGKERRQSLTSIHDSVESHVVALAAEASRLRGGEVVVLDDFVKALG